MTIRKTSTHIYYDIYETRSSVNAAAEGKAVDWPNQSHSDASGEFCVAYGQASPPPAAAPHSGSWGPSSGAASLGWGAATPPTAAAAITHIPATAPLSDDDRELAAAVERLTTRHASELAALKADHAEYVAKKNAAAVAPVAPVESKADRAARLRAELAAAEADAATEGG